MGNMEFLESNHFNINADRIVDLSPLVVMPMKTLALGLPPLSRNSIWTCGDYMLKLGSPKAVLVVTLLTYAAHLWLMGVCI